MKVIRALLRWIRAGQVETRRLIVESQSLNKRQYDLIEASRPLVDGASRDFADTLAPPVWRQGRR
jgi:hypothetical protein